MLLDLCARLDALETQRASYLDAVRPLAEADRRRKPELRAWSLNELVHHLLLIDTQVLRGIEAAFAAAPRSAGATAGLRAAFIRRVLALPVRIPAPPGAEGVMPRDTPGFEALAAEWARVRAAMVALLESATPARLDAAAFRHPIAGWFTLRDTLAFVEAHHAHHRPQLARLLAACGAEASPSAVSA